MSVICVCLCACPQRQFRECVLPELSDDGGYAEFAANKAVLAIAGRINRLTLYDPTRTQLLSLLKDYPRTWIHRLCQAQPAPCLICARDNGTCDCETNLPGTPVTVASGVSKGSLSRARVHAMQYGAGAQPAATAIKRPGRRDGDTEAFLVAWFAVR